MTEVHWTTPDPFVAEESIVAAVAAAALHGGRGGLEVSVVLVSARELTEMHAAHLADDSPTDVMTFDLGEEGGGPSGELYVSAERAVEVALERGVPVGRELLLYVVHGVLHLCGFNDHAPEDRDRMRAAERVVMEQIGQPPDDAPHDF